MLTPCALFFVSIWTFSINIFFKLVCRGFFLRSSFKRACLEFFSRLPQASVSGNFLRSPSGERVDIFPQVFKQANVLKSSDGRAWFQVSLQASVKRLHIDFLYFTNQSSQMFADFIHQPKRCRYNVFGFHFCCLWEWLSLGMDFCTSCSLF